MFSSNSSLEPCLGLEFARQQQPPAAPGGGGLVLSTPGTSSDRGFIPLSTTSSGLLIGYSSSNSPQRNFLRTHNNLSSSAQIQSSTTTSSATATMGKPSPGKVDSLFHHAVDSEMREAAQQSKAVKVSTHSGHFMSSNLDDEHEVDTVEGLGRGLGIEGPDPTSPHIVQLISSGTGTDIDQGRQRRSNAYNFATACQTPQDTYQFRANGTGGSKKDLDFDSSLSKLFACMTLAYGSGKLTTPKFKAFKGLKINIWDKMRLNNIIWREWHLQFVRKNKPSVCSFTVNMEDANVHSKPQSVVLEGKYWKRQLDIVCVEYQKWRVFYKKRIMPKIQSKLGIDELLERTAANETASLFTHQSHDQAYNLDDGDGLMDFSDTLFTTLNSLSQTNTDNNIFHSDFMQPNLVTLQPTLDDLGNMDTMEPFHDPKDQIVRDLLSEALGWNATPSVPSHFTGSLNNVSSNTYIPPRLGAQQLQNISLNHHQQTEHNFTSSTVPFLPMSSASMSINTDFTPIQVISQGMQQQHQQTLLPQSNYQQTVSQQQASSTFAMVLDSFNNQPTTMSQHQPNRTAVWNNSISSPLQSQGNNILGNVIQLQNTSTVSVTAASTPGNEFLKPKTTTPSRKPRPIAPKTATTASRPAPFLTQLLNRSSLSNNLSATPSSFSRISSIPSTVEPSKVFVPDINLVSRSNSVTQNATSASVTTSLNPQVSSSNIIMSPPKSIEVFSSPTLSISMDEKRESQSTSGMGTTAEQKRRTHIKNGFETLQTLVPTLANNPTNKISKAGMLSKTAEFALKLKTERQQMQEEADLLQQEIDALRNAISVCQCQLPATGVPVTGQHSDQMKEMLNTYIKDRTNQNWKFYVFSQIATPLFDSFNTIVSTASIEELYRTTQTWLDQHCTLPALRPAVLNSMRVIGTETAMLTDPQSFPEQAREAVNKLPTSLSNPDINTRDNSMSESNSS